MAKFYLTKKEALRICTDYQWLKGRIFHSSYGALTIDIIEPKKIDENSDVTHLLGENIYEVVVAHNAFSRGSIPEFFGFKNPSMDLFYYLAYNHMPFEFQKYI